MFQTKRKQVASKKGRSTRSIPEEQNQVLHKDILYPFDE